MEEKDSKIRVVMVENPEGNTDIVNLRKSFDGWRVVYPLRNQDGSLNWFNMLTGGSWWKLIVITIIVLIILGMFYEYSTNLNFCNQVLNNQTMINNKIIIP